MEYTYAKDDEALAAFMRLARLEGIIPALESAHAVAEVIRRAPKMARPGDDRESFRPRRQRRGPGGRQDHALSLVYLLSFAIPAVATWASLLCGTAGACGGRSWTTRDRARFTPAPSRLPEVSAYSQGWFLHGIFTVLAHFAWGLAPNVREQLLYGLGRRWPQLAAIAGGALGMLLLGIADDRHELRPQAKFLGQCLIATVVALSGVRVTLFVPNPAVTLLFTILWIVAVTNAVNFQDNMNGLCAGLALVAAGWFGFIAARQGHYLVASLGFLVAGGRRVFCHGTSPQPGLSWETPERSGWVPVGYARYSAPYYYSQQHPHRVAVLAPLLVLVVPLADMAAVVVHRWRVGRPFYVGSTNHFYTAWSARV